MKIIKSITIIFSLSLLAFSLIAYQLIKQDQTNIEPEPNRQKQAEDVNEPESTTTAACIYKDGSCCQGQGEQEICQTVQVDCKERKEPVIKGCNEKCDVVFECVASGESKASTSADNISDLDEVPPAPACQNLCGDDVCQEIVCLSISCPCAETAESCPQDCIENDETVDSTAEQKSGNNYYNNEYKFRLTFPDGWSTVLTDSCGKDCVEFFLPTTSTKWPSNKASKFVTSIFNAKIWEDYLKEEGPKPTYIAQRGTEIFTYSIAQDEPEDQIGKLREVKNIIATFQFLD